MRLWLGPCARQYKQKHQISFFLAKPVWAVCHFHYLSYASFHSDNLSSTLKLFHHKLCADNELTVNGDILTWSHNITHLGHYFNCCLSFRKDINIRKDCFIQCVNEICTEFAFAHPLNYYKYMEQAFMGLIYGIFIVKNLCLLAKPGVWPLERFIMYHFKHIVGFYKCLTIKQCNSHSRKLIHYVYGCQSCRKK